MRGQKNVNQVNYQNLEVNPSKNRRGYSLYVYTQMDKLGIRFLEPLSMAYGSYLVLYISVIWFKGLNGEKHTSIYHGNFIRVFSFS